MTTENKFNWNVDMRQDLNSFCSEYFYCTSCLREDLKLTKGSVRFDSLVQCEDHAKDTRTILNNLNDVIDNIEKQKPGTVKRITNLGLGE